MTEMQYNRHVRTVQLYPADSNWKRVHVVKANSEQYDIIADEIKKNVFYVWGKNRLLLSLAR